MDFTENNIQFRIVSSKLLEKYKSTQSFVLTEMLYGNYNFSKASREIALLVLDVVFAWLVGLENYLIRDCTSIFDKKAVDFAIRTADEAEAHYVSTIMIHDSIFDSKISKLWIDNHIVKMDMIREVIRRCEGLQDIEGFSVIVNTLLEMADSMRLELYEVDYIANNGKNPFLCLTDLSIMAYEEHSTMPIVDRAKRYKEITGRETFVLKNYSQEPNPVVYVKNLEEEAGIIIENKYNMIKKEGY
jgi:hypothetical protein